VLAPKPRSTKTTVYVLVGPPGTGKSRWASDFATRYNKVPSTTNDSPDSSSPANPAGEEDDHEQPYYKSRGDWWDGYTNNKVVIIDDFYGWLKYDELLRITDRYPHKCPVKGAFVEFVAEVIIFTSNVHVDKWYKFEGFNPEALCRRINTYLEFTEVNVEPTPYTTFRINF